jgi:hypothetical protein
MRRVAYLGADGEPVELSPEEAARVLERDPGLRAEHDKWLGVTGGREGRLVVLDERRVRRALAGDRDDA